ncbi:MAG: hypothetical protein SOZ07_06860 [Prevotella sp.]|nr:hypothetical protein [Prevotella sp.]MDD7273643.1 hypothetical protein [Prevotellaceae bacterium]MDY3936358.1 hypothetical protein [Prevotella sp.]MDY4218388.1 hypothetical protein [Prevotella sp.]
MKSDSSHQPTYTIPVAICFCVLFFGSLLLAYLMETRDMAPPRKYEVDMSGAVVGIDTTSKAPVLTKEEAKEVEVKENKKIDYIETPTPKKEETSTESEPIIVPSVPQTPNTGEPTSNAEQKVPTIKIPNPEPKIVEPKIENPN